MDNLDILNEIYQGVKMGMDSISTVSEKVGDEQFKQELSSQYNAYRTIGDKVNTKFEEYGEIPDDENLGQKVMSWTGIQMNTITDKSNSHISDLLIQGTTMGIIEGKKLLNQNPNADQNVKQILDEFIQLQENNIEKLKTYL